MLSRIAAIRPKAVMFSDARGGLGGTSGCRAIGGSQASAMLTYGLAVLPDVLTGVAAPYQVRKSGRHEGGRTATPLNS